MSQIPAEIANRKPGWHWLRALTVVIVAAASFALGLAVNQFRRQQRQDQSLLQQYPDWNAGTQVLPRSQINAAVVRYPTEVDGGAAGRNLDAIENTALRETIRRVYPACAAVGDGSGICVSSTGDVLTNAHVALALGKRTLVKFSDGAQIIMTCRALNRRLDLAVVSATVGRALPFARIAVRPPQVGQWVVCIGQPEPATPSGEATGFKPFHVSMGQILECDANPMGDQMLGRVRHNAWTYWGHSGAPLLDDRSEVVALHNSWDGTHGQRHAIPQQAIVQFLREADVIFEMGD